MGANRIISLLITGLTGCSAVSGLITVGARAPMPTSTAGETGLSSPGNQVRAVGSLIGWLIGAGKLLRGSRVSSLGVWRWRH
jgi:hypothetical protein